MRNLLVFAFVYGLGASGCVVGDEAPLPDDELTDEELTDEELAWIHTIDEDVTPAEGTNEGARGVGLETPPEDASLVYAGCLVVNGRCLNASEAKWVRWFASYVVPRLSGTRSARVIKASRVAWWALKEGILDLANPRAFSLCGYSNTRLGPLQVCGSGLPWQVGISGIQVTWQDLAAVETTARNRFPSKTISQILADAATQAGYPPGTTSTGRAIASSTGSLRKSWLLRQSVVGTERQQGIVYNECINHAYGWCYSSAWWPSSYFAPNRTAALRSIENLRVILANLAP